MQICRILIHEFMQEALDSFDLHRIPLRHMQYLYRTCESLAHSYLHLWKSIYSISIYKHNILLMYPRVQVLNQSFLTFDQMRMKYIADMCCCKHYAKCSGRLCSVFSHYIWTRYNYTVWARPSRKFIYTIKIT